MTKKRVLRAIDLYSGVGGWALGLRLAGIEVVASYERSGPANETNFKNNKHQAQTVDIRRLSLNDLPTKIDIVVGSPPCTQFSFSNRGGGGDIADGLEDIIKFLTVVDYLKPKAWAMENVPRVATIMDAELRPGGRLEQFRHLQISHRIINMEDYGLPQRRRRCIAGGFRFDLLASYMTAAPRKTLGEVVRALAADPVIDPIYGLSLPRRKVFDHDTEDILNAEEIRINRAAKTSHPVYNSMKFPDRLDRSVRTITATCTRVSRESIVIRDSAKANAFRRLTIRERACLQGFPITFQFYGSTYGQKLRMVGNAIPPSFAFLVGHALKETPADTLMKLSSCSSDLKSPTPPPIVTRVEKAGAHYPITRRFRFAIPSLRLKSGVRFELVNAIENNDARWEVGFYFGTSKSIQSLKLDRNVHLRLLKHLPKIVGSDIRAKLTQLTNFISSADVAHMQRIWSHRGVGRTQPFMLLDELDATGAALIVLLSGHEQAARNLVADTIAVEHQHRTADLPGLAKLERHASLILAGLLVGSLANMELTKWGDHEVPNATRRA